MTTLDGPCADPSCPIQGEHDHGLLRTSITNPTPLDLDAAVVERLRIFCQPTEDESWWKSDVRDLIEQVRKLTQQVNAAADEVGAAREAWAKYQGEYLLREQAEQRVKELEQQLELRRVATDMDYETACNIQQQRDAYREALERLASGIHNSTVTAIAIEALEKSK